MNSVNATSEIARGERFTFGDNWSHFLSLLSEEHILQAENSLRQLLQVDSLHGKTFLDVGSGSGLFSLAARRLGAKVQSFDFDPQSVACTMELRRRFFPTDTTEWIISEGSALDTDFLSNLGQWDIVYSWGVLHHTGSMWEALDNVKNLVKPNGQLTIAIYNDQGKISNMWKAIKRAYSKGNRVTKSILLFICGLYFFVPLVVRDLFLFGNPIRHWQLYKSKRGMSPYYDMIDWVGGYPFEVAKPEAIFEFYQVRGFSLQKLITCGGKLGCNQFVFQRIPTNPA